MRAPKALAAALVCAALAAGLAAAQTAPSMISFQGRLTDTLNNPLAGNHDFIFGVYDAPAGGALLWTETQTAVPVTNGVLAVQLGAATPLPASVFSAATAYLEITVDATPLSPRERLVTVPYAFNAVRLQGRDASAFVSTDTVEQTISALAVPRAGGTMSGQLTTESTLTVKGSAFSVGGSTFVVTGSSVGIGTDAPSKTLHVVGDILATGSIIGANLSGTNTGDRPKGSFGVTVDGGGDVIATGSMGFIIIPYDATIVSWHVVADQPGSVVVDLKRAGVSIIGGGGKPTLTGAQRANGGVAGWTSTSITENDEIEFNVDSASSVRRVNLVIKVNKL